LKTWSGRWLAPERKHFGGALVASPERLCFARVTGVNDALDSLA